MVTRISQTKELPDRFLPSSSPHPLPIFITSPLQSLTQPVFSIIGGIWQFLKTLLCCCIRFEQKAIYNENELQPEVSPSTFSLDDPFFQQVFCKDGSFQNAKALEVTLGILKILGQGGPWNWFQNMRTLKRFEQEHYALNIHPLETLFLFVMNYQSTKKVVHFKQTTMNAGSLQMLQRLSGRKNPWDEFVEKQSEAFKRYASHELFPMISGFCKALQLNINEIAPLVENQKWEKLIPFILEKRKLHFKL